MFLITAECDSSHVGQTGSGRPPNYEHRAKDRRQTASFYCIHQYKLHPKLTTIDLTFTMNVEAINKIC